MRFKFSPSPLSLLTHLLPSPLRAVSCTPCIVSKRFISPIYLFILYPLGEAPKSRQICLALRPVLSRPTQGQHTVTMVVTVLCWQGCAASNSGGIFNIPTGQACSLSPAATPCSRPALGLSWRRDCHPCLQLLYLCKSVKGRQASPRAPWASVSLEGFLKGALVSRT